MTLQGIPIFYVPERLWYRLTVKILGVGVLAVSDSEVSFRSHAFSSQLSSLHLKFEGL